MHCFTAKTITVCLDEFLQKFVSLILCYMYRKTTVFLSYNVIFPSSSNIHPKVLRWRFFQYPSKCLWSSVSVLAFLSNISPWPHSNWQNIIQMVTHLFCPFCNRQFYILFFFKISYNTLCIYWLQKPIFKSISQSSIFELSSWLTNHLQTLVFSFFGHFWREKLNLYCVFLDKECLLRHKEKYTRNYYT